MQQCAWCLILVLSTAALLLGWELGKTFPASLSFCLLFLSQENPVPGNPGRDLETQRENSETCGFLLLPLPPTRVPVQVSREWPQGGFRRERERFCVLLLMLFLLPGRPEFEIHAIRARVCQAKGKCPFGHTGGWDGCAGRALPSELLFCL